MNIKHVRPMPSRPLLRRAMVTLSLLLLSSMLLGCPCRPKIPKVTTVFVEKAQIRKTATPGWWEITDGWLAERLQYEQALQREVEEAREALKRCLESE